MTKALRRFGMIIELKEEYIDQYKNLHAGPGVRDLLSNSNIKNFSIFLKRMPNGRYYEFAYYQYIGNNYEEDMASLKENPRNIEWLKVCDTMQIPLPGQQGWEQLEEIYFNE